MFRWWREAMHQMRWIFWSFRFVLNCVRGQAGHPSEKKTEQLIVLSTVLKGMSMNSKDHRDSGAGGRDLSYIPS